MEEVQIIRKEKPNSFEFGKASNRFKIYFDNSEDLKQNIQRLDELGLIEEGTLDLTKFTEVQKNDI